MKFLSRDPYVFGWDSRTEKQHNNITFDGKTKSKFNIYSHPICILEFIFIPKLPRDGFLSLDSSWLMTLNSSFVSLWFPTSGGFRDLLRPNGELGITISPFVSNSENEPLFLLVTRGDSLNINASSSNGLFKLLLINWSFSPWPFPFTTSLFDPAFDDEPWERPENFRIVAGEYICCLMENYNIMAM